MEVLPLFSYALIMSITPGPNAILVAYSGVNFGFRRSLPHIFGIAAGFMCQAMLVASGFGLVLQSQPRLYVALKIFGALYLLYLAGRLALPRARLVSGEPVAAKPITFIEASLFQFLNPKAWLISVTCAAFLYGNGTTRATPAILSLYGGILFAALVPSVLTWNLFGAGLSRFLKEPRIRRAFDIVMAVLVLLSLAMFVS